MSKKLFKFLYFLFGFFIVLGVFGLNTKVHADTESTNLITGSDDFSGSYWNLAFVNNGYLGLTQTLEKDSDGDMAWHLSGTATSSGLYGLNNTENSHKHDTNVLSMYMKGTLGTGSIGWFWSENETITNQNWPTLQTDRYSRYVTATTVNADTAGTYNSDVLYFWIKSGESINLWVKHWKLESGSTMGYDETTIASGTDGTSKWTLDNNGVLSFGAGTLSKSDTQSILSTYEDDITSITTANADGKVYTPADASFLFAAPEVTDALQNAILQSSWSSWESITDGPSTNSKITSMDLSNLDTSNTTNMTGMFSLQKSLKTISGTDNLITSTTTNVSSMFYYDIKLESINVASWDTSNIVDADKFFALDSALQKLDVSKWNVSRIRHAGCMFQNDSTITTLDVSNWNTSSMGDTSWMFGGMENLKTLDVSNWDMSHVVSMRKMFINTALTSLDVSKWNTSQNTSLENTFNGMPYLKTLDVSNFDTSKTTDLTGTFLDDSSLESLDVSNWDVSKVTSLNATFQGMTNLKSLDVSKWNTANVTNMATTFKAVVSLTSLDLSSFNTSAVTNMYGMFSGMTSLQTLNLSNFNTTKATTTDILKNDTKLAKLSVDAKTTLTSTSLPEFKWINDSSLSNYYPTTSALFANPVAGTYKLYTAPTIIKVSPINITLTSGDDMSQVSLGITSALSYQTNDAAKTTFSMALRLLNGKAYSINSPFSGISSLDSSASGVVNTVNSSTENTTSQELPFSKSSTIDLSALKYWYTGTYTTTITYTIDDNH